MYDRCIPTTKAVLSAGVDVVVDVTANHLGYFSFNLCPPPSPPLHRPTPFASPPSTHPNLPTPISHHYLDYLNVLCRQCLEPCRGPDARSIVTVYATNIELLENAVKEGAGNFRCLFGF